jgi:hypothetical protein
MNIILSSQNVNFINDFTKLAKEYSTEIIHIKTDGLLFDAINIGDVDAFVFDNLNFTQKVLDFAKKKQPYIPRIVVGKEENIVNLQNANAYIPFSNTKNFYLLIIKNINSYKECFKSLQKLTTKVTEQIKFGNCIYNPNKRVILYDGKEISLSEKTGKIMEILASNFRSPVKKEFILERAWHKDDYYSSRSMDVYISGIRKVFQKNGIKMEIRNVKGIGLILE